MTWQYNLKGKVDTSINVDVFDIDMFDNTKETISALKAKGKFVICYINVGSFEKWRPDAAKFPKSIIGKKMDGWDEVCVFCLLALFVWWVFLFAFLLTQFFFIFAVLVRYQKNWLVGTNFQEQIHLG